jgi:hypothetical protein
MGRPSADRAEGGLSPVEFADKGGEVALVIWEVQRVCTRIDGRSGRFERIDAQSSEFSAIAVNNIAPRVGLAAAIEPKRRDIQPAYVLSPRQDTRHLRLTNPALTMLLAGNLCSI